MRGEIGIYLFLSLCIRDSLSVANEGYGWLYTLSEQLQRLKPHQLTFFINDSNRRYIDEQNYKFNQEYPVQDSGPNKPIWNKDDQSLSSSVLFDPRHVTLNIISDQVDYESAYSTIDVLAHISSLPIRQQCLIISFGENDNSEDIIGPVLKHAWTNKFLDFSILSVDRNENIFIGRSYFFSFNPFENCTTNNSFVANIPIFPNKLKDVKGRPMKMSFSYLPPFQITRTYGNGSIYVEGRHYPFVDFALKTMDFTATTFTLEITNFSSNFVRKTIEKALRKGDINMISILQDVPEPGHARYYRRFWPRM